MEAGKFCDLCGSLPGHVCQQSDAEQAYCQATLKGMETWVRLPEDRWPESWKKLRYRDPVVPLIKALYGRPDSGGWWEQHCDSVLKTGGS